MTAPQQPRGQQALEIVRQAADRIRRFVTERRALSAGIAGGLVLVLVLVLVFTAGGGGSPAPAPTGALPTPSVSPTASGVSGKPALPTRGAYLGAYAAPHGATAIDGPGAVGGNGDINGAAITALEKQIGTGLAIDHRYFRWDEPFSVPMMREMAAQGRIPFLAFQVFYKQDGQTAHVSYAQIASGAEDGSLRARADAAKAFGKPMFVSFQHEPNRTIGSVGSAAQYVAAWRHIVDVFRQQGASNVAFVYVQTAYSFRNGSSLDDSLYPGADYIDWIAADGYNFFACPGKKAGWSSLNSIFSAFYQWGTAHHKPLMIAELGVSEDPSDPGRKGEWYRQVAQQITGFPQIKAVVYFNGAPVCQNWVDSSPSALAGFKALAHDPYFITRSGG